MNLQVVLNGQEKDSLETIKKNGHFNNADAVRKALRLYQYLIKEQDNGRILLTAKNDGTDPHKLVIL